MAHHGVDGGDDDTHSGMKSKETKDMAICDESIEFGMMNFSRVRTELTQITFISRSLKAEPLYGTIPDGNILRSFSQNTNILFLKRTMLRGENELRFPLCTVYRHQHRQHKTGCAPTSRLVEPTSRSVPEWWRQSSMPSGIYVGEKEMATDVLLSSMAVGTGHSNFSSTKKKVSLADGSPRAGCAARHHPGGDHFQSGSLVVSLSRCVVAYGLV